ncbi:methyltransferase domain-containing protein [Xylariaceae sp. FL0016]|nr:methyltransferase domain-containing protein [Xylariaceae sp. FL0016]
MGISDTREDRLYSTIYSPSFLSIVYDVFVLRFNLRYMWRCRKDTVLEPFYSENLSRRHLDIGVATGYFPALTLARPFRTRWRHQITLVDINPHPLQASKARILSKTSNTEVECVVADATAPPPKQLQDAQFDSISMFNLFHCIPGTNKLQAFSNYKDLLADNGVLSGCTVLGGKHATNWFNYLYLKLYNRVGIFHNWDDTLEDFEKALHENFDVVETTVVGMLLLWRATKPKREQSV